MACRMRGSVMPRPATWRSTMSALWCANPRSCSSFRGGKVAKRFLERLQTGDGCVMGEVQVQRRDGDEARLDRFEVRPFSGMPGGRFSADPVVAAAPGIFPLDDPFRIDPLSELGDLHARKLADREVHVQHD